MLALVVGGFEEDGPKPERLGRGDPRRRGGGFKPGSSGATRALATLLLATTAVALVASSAGSRPAPWAIARPGRSGIHDSAASSCCSSASPPASRCGRGGRWRRSRCSRSSRHARADATFTRARLGLAAALTVLVGTGARLRDWRSPCARAAAPRPAAERSGSRDRHPRPSNKRRANYMWEAGRHVRDNPVTVSDFRIDAATSATAIRNRASGGAPPQSIVRSPRRWAPSGSPPCVPSFASRARDAGVRLQTCPAKRDGPRSRRRLVGGGIAIGPRPASPPGS